MPISSAMYRLRGSSGFGEVYYGDVIEVVQGTKGENRFSRVVSRSGLQVNVFVLPQSAFASANWESFQHLVTAQGGIWERAYGGVLFVHMPPGSTLDVSDEVKSLTATRTLDGSNERNPLASQDAPQIERNLERSSDSQPAGSNSTFSELTGNSLSPPSLSAEDPVWNGWDVLLIAGLTLLTLFIVEFATVIAARLLFYPKANLADVAQKPVLALIGEFLSYIAVALYMIMLVEGKYHAPFWQAIRWNWRGKATLSLLGLGVLTVSLDLLSRFLPMPKTTPFDQFFAHPSDAYLMAVFAVTFGPLMEELFFRGFLYPVLARRVGVAAAVLLTALPFGLIHYLQYKSWAAVLVITLVGVVLTVVRAVTKSVAASFLVHVGYNATLMMLAALATDGFRHMEKATLTLQR